MSWEKVKLNKITFELNSGGRPKGGADSKGTIPSIGAEHLDGNGGFNFSNIKYIPFEYYINMSRGKINIDDILIVKDGATTGKVSYVSNEFIFENSAINEHVFQLRLNKEKCIPKYCFYYLISDVGRKEVLSDFRGATVGGISKGVLDKVQIPLPPLHIQQQIADILDKADALRQKDQQLLQKYDELAQSIFYDMFGDPVKNEKGWVVKDLIDCVTIRGGGTPSTSKAEYFDGDIPWVSPKDMKFTLITTSIDKITELAIKESSTTLLETNCVLMVVRSGILKKSLPLAINVVPVAINQDMKALKTKDSLNPYFLLYYTKSG